MPTIPEYIKKWRNKEISGTLLMRLLVSHPGWILPVSEAAAAEILDTHAASRIQYNRDPKGINRLMVFSSPETFTTYRQNSGQQNAGEATRTPDRASGWRGQSSEALRSPHNAGEATGAPDRASGWRGQSSEALRSPHNAGEPARAPDSASGWRGHSSEALRSPHNLEQHILTTTGVWVFRLPLEGIDEIWIDPLTADDSLFEGSV